MPAESEVVGRWDEIVSRFDRWAEDLRYELDQPDLWASVGSGALSGLEPLATQNDPFSPEETLLVREKLHHLRRYLSEESESNELLAQRLDAVIAGIERLDSQAREGLGRVDWLNQLVGLSINIIVACSFAPERASSLIGFLRTLFSDGLKVLIGS